MVDVRQRKFALTLETSGDNRLSRDEFIAGYMPSIDHILDDETSHVLSECDADRNAILSQAEIVAIRCCPTLIKNQLTNFGHDLLKISTESVLTQQTQSSSSSNDSPAIKNEL